jgi:hypothetical protein
MRVAAALLVLVLVLATAGAPAQPPPALAIDAPPALAAARARLEGFDLRPLSTIVRVVGLGAPGPPIRVVLAGDDSDWARQVPSWTAGFAVGEAGLIVLFPSRSPRYPHDTLEDVLRHEVAHVLITRAAGGRPVPRWFHEGLAVAVERPWALEDRARVASALMFGPRLGLDAIGALFDGSQSAQSRGYALSAAVVRHMIGTYGASAPADILREIASGRPFDLAVTRVTARPVPAFEDAFWADQRTWTRWVPLITSSTVLWLGIIGLGVLAVRRRRLRAAGIRSRWAEEEAVARGDRGANDELISSTPPSGSTPP